MGNPHAKTGLRPVAANTVCELTGYWKLETDDYFAALSVVWRGVTFGLNMSPTSLFPFSRNGTPFSIHSGFGLPSR